jgi:DNA-binding transcriptional regulator YiaG
MAGCRGLQYQGKPNGPSLKLLNLVEQKGLDALA